MFSPPVEAVAPDAPLPPSVRPYRSHSQVIWDEARRDYAEGWSAKEVCMRYDIGLSALRTRARNEGWRRADLVEDEPLPYADAEPAEALPLLEMVDLAWRSASQAVRRGKVYEARAWMRLVKELRDKIAGEIGEAEHRRFLLDGNPERIAKGLKPLTPSLHPLHSISRVQSEPDPPPASMHPVDRLQREDRPGEEEAEAVGGHPKVEPDHGDRIHLERDRRGAPLFPNRGHPNLNQPGRETTYGKQGGGVPEADGIEAHPPSTMPNDRGCGGTRPCGPG